MKPAQMGRNVSTDTSSSEDARSSLAILSDEALMVRVGVGDEPAFRVLVDRHLGSCTGLATRILFRRDDAEDVMQEAFLRLWRHAPSWKPDGAKFTTWFYRVIVNLCIDHQRKTQRRPKTIANHGAGDEDASSIADNLVDEGESADRLIERNETKREVLAALSALPDRQMMAISLCYFQELSNKEAAQIMDINIKALESLLNRGRKGLAARVGHLKKP